MLDFSLDGYKENFIQCASGIKDYDKLSETELANGYCDAIDNNDVDLSNQYYAALMVKYWYKIYKYKATCKSTRLRDEDYISWLSDALNIAFRYRDWKNPEKDIYGDPKAVDKIINRCCFSIRGYYFQEFNKDKRKINYLTDSVEGQFEKFGDAADANLGVEDEEKYWVDDFISTLISRDEVEKAIMVDSISYQDSFKETTTSYYVDEPVIEIKANEEIDFDDYDENEEKEVKTVKVKYSSTDHSFNKRKLKQELSHLSDNYFNYFKNKYHVSDERLNKAVAYLTGLSKNKMYKFIDDTLISIKDDLKELLQC